MPLNMACCGPSLPCIKPNLHRLLNEADAEGNQPEPSWCTFQNFSSKDLRGCELIANGFSEPISLCGYPTKLLDFIAWGKETSIVTPLSDSTPGILRLDTQYNIRHSHVPDWSESGWLKSMAQKVSAELRVFPCDLRAKGVLIAEKGAFLKPCKFAVDSEAGGFGTLMVGIPGSECEQIFFSFGKREKGFEQERVLDPYDDGTPGFVAAWFSDVSFGFTPNEGSKLMMLEFEFLTTISPCLPSARLKCRGESKLVEALKYWEQYRTGHQYLCHVLDPVYQDKEPEECAKYASALQEQVYHIGFTILLADLHKKMIKSLELGPSEGDSRASQSRFKTEIHSIEKYMMTVYLPDAVNTALDGFDIIEKNILDTEYFEKLRPCKKERASHVTGQAHLLGTWWYSDVKAVIILPNHELHSMLTDHFSLSDRNGFSEYLIQRSLTPLTQSLINQNFWQHIRPTLMRVEPSTWTRELFMNAIQACLHHGDYEFFRRLVIFVDTGDIRASIEACNLMYLLRTAILMNPGCVSNLLFQDGLSQLLAACHDIHDRKYLLKRLTRLEWPNDLRIDFVDSELAKIIESAGIQQELMSFDTAIDLVDISLKSSVFVELLENKAGPAINGPAAVCGFLSRLLSRTVYSNHLHHEYHDFRHSRLCRPVIELNAALRIFEKVWSKAHARRIPKRVIGHYSEYKGYCKVLQLPSGILEQLCEELMEESEQSISVSPLTKILDRLQTLGLTKQGSEFASAIADEADLSQRADLWCTWVPLLRDILYRQTIASPMLKEKGYRKLFTKVLFRFVVLFTPLKEPELSGPGNSKNCSCSLCKTIPDFKTSTDEKGEFRVCVNTKREVQHILSMFMTDILNAQISITDNIKDFYSSSHGWSKSDDDNDGDDSKEDLGKFNFWIRKFPDFEATWKAFQKEAGRRLGLLLDEKEKLVILIGEEAYRVLSAWASGALLTEEDIKLLDPDASTLAPSSTARKRRFSETGGLLSEEGQQEPKRQAT